MASPQKDGWLLSDFCYLKHMFKDMFKEASSQQICFSSADAML
jgi:hypothetical protein